MMDDKQAREKERIANDLCQWCEGYTVKEIFSEALQEYANLCLRENLIRSVEIAAEKDERIESLSAQVAALTKERDQYLHELEDAENQITGYWSRQKQRAEAAEAQVAELKHHLALAGYQEDASYDDEIYEVMTEFNDEIGSIAHELIQSRAQVAELKKDPERRFQEDHAAKESGDG